MWHYFWGHIAYHLASLMSNKTKTIMLLPLIALISFITCCPQIYVIYNKNLYIMHCPFPLSMPMKASLVYTTFMLSFVVAFYVLEDVSQRVKQLFHLFGIADAIYGVFYLNIVYKARVCRISASEIYTVIFTLAVLVSFTFVFFLVVCALWIKNLKSYHKVVKREGGSQHCNRCSIYKCSLFLRPIV